MNHEAEVLIAITPCPRAVVSQSVPSAMVLSANDVGLVKVRTVLPSNVILDLLTKHVTLPSDPQQPGPAHRFEINGKVCQAFFQKQWLEEYHWLVWSPSQNGGYCKYCVLFAKLPRGNSHGGGIFGKLITKPFQDYKRAKGNDGVLVIHEKYQYHKEAVLMFLSQCNDTTLRIDNILDHQLLELADSNTL